MGKSIFGENLKYYRNLLGMVQEDFAKSMGVTRSTLANYESGRSEPSFAFVCKAASVLGVSIEQLLTNYVSEEYTRRLLVTDEESELVRVFREADPVYRNVAMDILRSHRRQE